MPEYHAAVAVSTASGEGYVFLFQYEVPTEIPVYLYRKLGDEMKHVTDAIVDAQGFCNIHITNLIEEAVNAINPTD